jgi:threonine/homoserine/homoserine lactone efflux protein
VDPLFVAYLSLTAALAVSPGATTAVVVRNTLSGGWRGGVAAAAGAALGNSTHATAAGLGLAVVVARVPAILLGIQLAGGLYLAWLAFGSVRRIYEHAALPASDQILAARTTSGHHAAREGITVNLLNPAIALFYLAVVPSFVPDPAPRGYYVQLAAIHVAMAFLCHCAWAFGLDRLRHVLKRPGARIALEALTAGALFLLAGRVLSEAMRSLW